MNVYCKDSYGYTLVELLVVISASAVFLAASTSVISSGRSSFEVSSARNSVLAFISQARALAIEEGAYVYVSAAGDNSRLSMSIDRYPFEVRPNVDSLVSELSLGKNIELTLDNSLFFNPRGFLVDLYDAQENVDISVSYNNVTYCSGVIYSLGRPKLIC